jgi:signal transduction histidine kinase
LRIPLALRLALGFFLAALFAATATWLIGIQHAETISKQSNFYQVLLRTNTMLTNGSELLKSIDSQSTKTLADAATDHPNRDIDERGLSTLMTRYDRMLLGYASSDLLSQRPDLCTLLGDNNIQTLIRQQSTYTSGALHTWQNYHNIQNSILQNIELGNISQAQNIAHLQAEPAYADALSALHSLIQFNEQLSTWVDKGANNETQQQLIETLLGSFLAFLGVLLICVVVSYSLVHRLKQLHQVTQAVERGQTGARVSVIGRDEIADVSNSVNTMLDALVEAIRQTTAAKKQVDHAYQQERQLNQMKDQFIRNVSHELRTPLTEIYGFLQLLHEQQGKLDSSMQTLFVEQAIHGCEDLLSLFNTILDAARINTTPPAPTLEKLSLHPIIQSIIEQCDPRERAEHPLSLEVPESLTVWANAEYLRQVLRNLVENAFKYTPPKAAVFIRTRWNKTAKDASVASSHVCICVRDTGPGIPPEEQELLFQQFVRLKRDLSGTIRGTGLGLYLCRQFVEAMNGHIWVESSGIAGEGSSFCFTLPLEPSTVGEI